MNILNHPAHNATIVTLNEVNGQSEVVDYLYQIPVSEALADSEWY